MTDEKILQLARHYALDHENWSPERVIAFARDIETARIRQRLAPQPSAEAAKPAAMAHQTLADALPNGVTWGDELTHEIAGAIWDAALRSRAPVAAQASEPVALEDIEQYRLQMAGISTASFGYWKEGDSIHPDYDTLALRDVAKLYAKYDALYHAPQPSAEAVRDAAYEAAAAICHEEGNEWDSDALQSEKNYAHACRDRIRALKSDPPQPAEQPSASMWVSVNDRLPKFDCSERVLVYTDGTDFAGEQFFDIKSVDLYPTPDGKEDTRSEVAAAVTHWMERPFPCSATTTWSASPAAQSSGQAAPSDEEIEALALSSGLNKSDEHWGSRYYTELGSSLFRFARALLSRYGQAPAANGDALDALDRNVLARAQGEQA